MRKFPFIIGVCLFLWRQVFSQPPVSHEARYIESVSPTEVMIEAAGIGKNTKLAEIDARKCAIYFLLFLSTDPILKTDEEKSRFRPYENTFFDPENISKYITWESTAPIKRIRLAKKKIKIVKRFKVNKEMLYQDLVSKGIVKAREELMEEVGLPSIMVLPETPKGENPLAALGKRLNRHAATVIESYLTAKGYDVNVPEAEEQLTQIKQAVKGIRGLEEDDAYALALSIGSDIYIKYQIAIQSRYLAGRKMTKASATLKAYETTTGKLLGAETGYSKERPSPPEVCAEEALHDACDKVLQRIMNYWKVQAAKGKPFKVVVSIEGITDEDELEDVQFAVEDALKEACEKTKLITSTEKTMEFTVWSKLSGTTELYRAIKRAFKRLYRGEARMRRGFHTRKLLMLEIVAE